MLKLLILFIKENLPIFLAIFLYILIYLLRTQQGGWEVQTEIFSSQREVLDKQISKFLPSPQAELLSGILLGQNKDLPASLKLALRDTSTLHIVVASGQNLSMVAGFFLALSPIIKRRNAILLSTLAVGIYTLLTGLQVPILRAAAMFGFSALAQLFNRQKGAFWGLIITAGLMLLINPGWLFSLSFQLSFLATYGVVILAPILLKNWKGVPVIGQDLAVTIGAQLMVMPVILQNFHQLSLVSVFANLLIGWTIPFIMVIGAITLVLSFMSLNISMLFSWGISSLLTYFIYIVEFFSSLPFAWEYIGEQSPIVWIGYYILLGGIMLLLNNAKTEDSRGSEKSS